MMAESDPEDAVERDDGPQEPVRLCPQCLWPMGESQYYCDNCDAAANPLSPYIPFVNIRFNYAVFGRMWKRVWGEVPASVHMRLLCFALIVACAPIMLVGAPFALWDWLRSRRRPTR